MLGALLGGVQCGHGRIDGKALALFRTGVGSGGGHDGLAALTLVVSTAACQRHFHLGVQQPVGIVALAEGTHRQFRVDEFLGDVHDVTVIAFKVTHEEASLFK